MSQLRPARPGPARTALITLPTGLLIEVEGKAIVHIDVGDGAIGLNVKPWRPLRYGISAAGLDDATRAAGLAVRRSVVRRLRDPKAGSDSPAPRAQQGQLFATRTDVIDLDEDIDEGRMLRRLRDAILDRCRAVALAREPRIDEVAARVRAVDPALVDTPLVYGPAVLDVPWLVDDVLRFRAAAMAVAMAETLPPPTRADAGVRALIPLLTRWRSLFASEGHVTRSVHKTIALLDERTFAGVDPRDAWRLRQVPLVQPITSPRHLRLLSERQQLGGQHLKRDLRLLQLVDDDALDEATDEVTRSLRLHRVALRQREHVLCEVLGQAEARPGDDRLAASQAVQILVHRRLDAVRLQRRRLPRVAGVEPVAVAPPIPLPDDLRLRFLVSEDDFLSEGERMHHCVGTYFATAAAGEGYFFHFEDEVGTATVHIGRSGQIVEANGICNTKNASVRRATEVLSRWGAPLSVLALGDADTCLWHDLGPTLDEVDRPLRTLVDLAQAIALELEAGTVKDVHVYLDMVRGTAARALRGAGWMFFDTETRRVRAIAADDDVEVGSRSYE